MIQYWVRAKSKVIRLVTGKGVPLKPVAHGVHPAHLYLVIVRQILMQDQEQYSIFNRIFPHILILKHLQPMDDTVEVQKVIEQVCRTGCFHTMGLTGEPASSSNKYFRSSFYLHKEFLQLVQ